MHLPLCRLRIKQIRPMYPRFFVISMIKIDLFCCIAQPPYGQCIVFALEACVQIVAQY